MNNLLQQHDWSGTPLGPKRHWPVSLRAICDLLAASPVAMRVLWGAESIQIYNDAFGRLCGARHPRALGQPVFACWPERRCVDEPIHAAVLRGESRQFRSQPWTIEPGGVAAEARFDLSYSPLTDDDGAIAGLLLIVTETPHQPPWQAVTDQWHRLQKIEAIGQLMGGLVHDFNNVLQTMSGSLHLIERRAGANPQIRSALDVGRQGVERGNRLVGRLQAFASHRQEQLEADSFDVGDRLLGLRGVFERALGQETELIFELRADAGSAVADAVQFDLAILNLLSNARDAIAGRGRVTIGTDQAGRAGEAGPNAAFVRIWVRDTGPGIAAGQLARVFEPFFTTRSMSRALGLGLAQVHAFCAQSAGAVQADSVEGQGTTVSLWLPRAIEARPAHEPSSPAAAGNRPCVMLVERDPAVGAAIASALGDFDYRVVQLLGAEQALSYLEKGGVADVLLSDVALPGIIDGIELAQRARQLRSPLAVLLTTESDQERARRAGVPVLSKPYRIDQLATALKEHLASSHYQHNHKHSHQRPGDDNATRRHSEHRGEDE